MGEPKLLTPGETPRLRSISLPTLDFWLRDVPELDLPQLSPSPSVRSVPDCNPDCSPGRSSALIRHSWPSGDVKLVSSTSIRFDPGEVHEEISSIGALQLASLQLSQFSPRRRERPQERWKSSKSADCLGSEPSLALC